MTEDITLLCTGDLHLGRHPSRIPESYSFKPFSPRAIWESTVDTALREDVDGVLISGDIADNENEYFEAFGAFEAGVTRLNEAGIPTVVVAGNHDHDVLPRMVEDIEAENLTLLGTDGTWERTALEADGEPVLHVDGWSFPRESVPGSPVKRYDESADVDTPIVGLLHADLTDGVSDYAPIETDDLVDTPLDAWVLGHIHRPQVHHEEDPLLFYPGSPQPLDPGEPGTHGPWLVRLRDVGSIETQQLSLASLWYDSIEVDVTGVSDREGLVPPIQERLTEYIESHVDGGSLELFLANIRLTGRTDAHGEIVANRDDLADQLAVSGESYPVEVETVEVDTSPAVDLEDLSGENTPVGYLADLLLTMEHGDTIDGEYDGLLQTAEDAVQRAQTASPYRELRRERELPTADEAAREELERQARLLLDTLLEQKEGNHA